ncbi:hypothetical protein ACWIUD_09560 [Helicobacter sp. 23-1044]
MSEVKTTKQFAEFASEAKQPSTKKINKPKANQCRFIVSKQFV